jgi:hypothetical protein
MRKLGITTVAVITFLAVNTTAAQADYGMEATHYFTGNACTVIGENCSIELEGYATLSYGEPWQTTCEVAGTAKFDSDGSAVIDNPRLDRCYPLYGPRPCDDQSGALPWDAQIKVLSLEGTSGYVDDLALDVAMCAETNNSQLQLNSTFTFSIETTTGSGTWDLIGGYAVTDPNWMYGDLFDFLHSYLEDVSNPPAVTAWEL